MTAERRTAAEELEELRASVLVVVEPLLARQADRLARMLEWIARRLR